MYLITILIESDFARLARYKYNNINYKLIIKFAILLYCDSGHVNIYFIIC